MGLYSFESSNTLGRIAGQFVVADTSYLIALNTPTEPHYASALVFHNGARASNADFVVNVVARLELIKKIRDGLIAGQMFANASASSALEARYRAVSGLYIRRGDGLREIIARNVEKLFKDHIRNGDTATVIGAPTLDIWAETQKLEQVSNVTYLGSKDISSDPAASLWTSLANVIKTTGMAATDSMIANFAFEISADAIATCDCDYAQVANMIDVYMPLSICALSAAYDASLD